jgi:hypothetical protein
MRSYWTAPWFLNRGDWLAPKGDGAPLSARTYLITVTMAAHDAKALSFSAVIR